MIVADIEWVFSSALNKKGTLFRCFEMAAAEGISALESKKERKVVSMASMYEDRVALVKADGTVSHKDLLAVCGKGTIQLHDATVPIESGDHLLRDLPNGMVEDYLVEEATLHRGLGMAYYEVAVRKTSTPLRQQPAAIQHITNIYQGAHGRANVNSTDNSINITGDGTTFDKLQAHVEASIPAGPERDGILHAAASMKEAGDAEERLSSYQRLVQAASNHITVLGPFLPALTAMLN